MSKHFQMKLKPNHSPAQETIAPSLPRSQVSRPNSTLYIHRAAPGKNPSPWGVFQLGISS